MAIGPGKYDKQCTQVRLETNAAGVILLVFQGNQGDGFDVQLVPGLVEQVNLPALLRHLGDLIEQDLKQAKDQTGQN